MNKNRVLIVATIGAFIILAGLYFVLVGSKQSAPINYVTNDDIGSPEKAPNLITIKENAFTPSTLTVKAGDIITVENEDAENHSVLSDTNTFDSGLIAEDERAEIKISTPGTYTYHCSLHPEMKGTIIVTE